MLEDSKGDSTAGVVDKRIMVLPEAMIRRENEVSVEPRSAFHANRNPMLNSVSLGPNFALGRGLSLLKGLKARRSGRLLEVEGEYGGTPFEATVDPNAGYLASRIVRYTFDHKREWAVWTMSGLRRDTKGFFYPAASRVVIGLEPGSRTTIESEYERIETGVPTEADLGFDWTSTGMKLADRRVTPPVGYKASEIDALKRGGPLTLARLLQVSKEKAGRFAAAEKVEGPRKRVEGVPARTLATGAVGVAAVAVAFWSRRRKPA